MAMTVPLRVLIVEDRQADAELLVYTLRQSGFGFRLDARGYPRGLSPESTARL